MDFEKLQSMNKQLFQSICIFLGKLNWVTFFNCVHQVKILDKPLSMGYFASIHRIWFSCPFCLINLVKFFMQYDMIFLAKSYKVSIIFKTQRVKIMYTDDSFGLPSASQNQSVPFKIRRFSTFVPRIFPWWCIQKQDLI